MAITDPLLLPPDVLLVPVAELPEELRGQLRCDEGDYAVTRPRSRTPSRVIDSHAAELLAEFKSPRTIVEAVLRYSLAREVDPEETLEQAYPLLQGLMSSGFLVAEGDAGAEGIHPSFVPGDEIAGCEVVECIQGLEDTELYQVRGLGAPGHFAALKIERPASAGKTGLFEREAAILEHLNSDGAPRLLATGEVEGRRYLAVEWLAGVDAVTAAEELRRAGDRAGLLALCRAIARAYAGLHRRDVIHGDVHPRNVLVAADDSVRLIDFGIARWAGIPDRLARIWRGGVAFYFEPEYALAVQAGAAPPDATPAGEQYGVAALIYQLASGVHYLDFSLEKREMLRQIAEEPPLVFANRGLDPWPGLEAALSRSLSKHPADRFASLDALVDALNRVEEGEYKELAGPSPVDSLLARVLDRIGAGSPLFAQGFSEAPRGSINYGAAGIACACLRLAQTREDAGLLSLADQWITRALRDVDQAGSFYNPEIGLEPEIVGRVSPYHTATGLFCVQALVAHAQGEGGLQREAITAFLAGAEKPCENPDLTLGRSGVLLAAAFLLDTMTGDANLELRKSLTALGDDLLAGLWQELDAQPPIARCDRLANLGIAHGWAGYLYASLQWCRAAGTPRPARLEERLAELAATAQPWGRGLRWPWYGDGEGHRRNAGSMPGWCNGSAGFVFLWTLAHRELGDSRWLALATGAARNAWESPEGNGSLCCGLGGRAYALLNYYRHAGGPGGKEWLARARALANRAALDIEKGSEHEDSLYKGAPGVALLAADLAHPETAAMPFFEEEGWSG